MAKLVRIIIRILRERSIVCFLIFVELTNERADDEAKEGVLSVKAKGEDDSGFSGENNNEGMGDKRKRRKKSGNDGEEGELIIIQKGT